MISKAVVNLALKDGRVIEIPCHRHGDAFTIAKNFGLLPSDIDKSRTRQGFLTDDGRFVMREDAMLIAMSNGQVPMEQAFELRKRGFLLSEDVW